MAVKAYMFIETCPGKAQEARDGIIRISGVKDAHLVTGPHDIVALIGAPDIKSLGTLVISQIQAVGGVNKTLTSIVA